MAFPYYLTDRHSLFTISYCPTHSNKSTHSPKRRSPTKKRQNTRKHFCQFSWISHQPSLLLLSPPRVIAHQPRASTLVSSGPVSYHRHGTLSHSHGGWLGYRLQHTSPTPRGWLTSRRNLVLLLLPCYRLIPLAAGLGISTGLGIRMHHTYPGGRNGLLEFWDTIDEWLNLCALMMSECCAVFVVEGC